MVLHHDVSVSLRLQHSLGLRLLRRFLSIEIVNSGSDAGFHPVLPMAGDRPSALALLRHSSVPSQCRKMGVRGAVSRAEAVQPVAGERSTGWVEQGDPSWPLRAKDMECPAYRSHDSRTWRVRFRDWGNHRRMSDQARCCRLHAALNVRFRDHPISDLATDEVKVFGCREASENRPSTNPRGCGDGLWGFRVLRGWDGCEAGSVRRLAAAPCVRFVAWRMVDWEQAAAERQQLSADPNARRALGHSLQRWCCGVT
jgi:hypothetical protein